MSTPAPFSRLLAAADHHYPGHEANSELWASRAERLAEHGKAATYELVIDPSQAGVWERLWGDELPKLGRFIEMKGLPPGGDRSLCVAVWSEEIVYLFSAPKLFSALAEIEGISIAEAILRSAPRTKPNDGGLPQ